MARWNGCFFIEAVMSNFSNSDCDGIFRSSLLWTLLSKGNILQYDYAIKI